MCDWFVWSWGWMLEWVVERTIANLVTRAVLSLIGWVSFFSFKALVWCNHTVTHLLWLNIDFFGYTAHVAAWLLRSLVKRLIAQDADCSAQSALWHDG